MVGGYAGTDTGDAWVGKRPREEAKVGTKIAGELHHLIIRSYCSVLRPVNTHKHIHIK